MVNVSSNSGPAVAERPPWTEARRLVTVGGSLFFLLLLVRTAWLNDDSYITFRTIDNFLSGFGLRWNVADRVQVFTHPLWMFVIIAANWLVSDIYYAAILVCIGVSLAALAVVSSRLAASTRMAVLAWSVFALSKAFVDYSTSGLENPLTHLLLALFFAIYIGAMRQRMLALSLITAFLMLNRIDSGLLVLPTLVVEVRRLGLKRALPDVCLGFLPLVAWELFSLVYYGFLVPNTAYSKLGPGVPRAELMFQGALYLIDSVANDHLTMFVIAAAVLSPLLGVGAWSVSFGITLYLLYVLWVGGDFMSGRFLTAPLMCAVIQLVRWHGQASNAQWGVAIAAVWLTGLSTPRPPIISTAAYGSDVDTRVTAPNGISDERRFYYQQSGLLTAHRGVPMPNHKWLHMGHDGRTRGERVATTDAAGFIGYAAGPAIHYVDRYGLGDAFLARLPGEVPWRIGHFVRKPPDGYLETLADGVNVIRDPGLAKFYDQLRIIVAGPIWTRERFAAILAMNTGRYDGLVESYGLVRLSWSEVEVAKPNGTEWNAPGTIELTLRGLEVDLDELRKGGRLELSVSRNDAYEVRLLRTGATVHQPRVRPIMQADGDLETFTIDVPVDVEFDAVRVKPWGGDSRYSLGHLRVMP